jgi:hypothetical protein
VGGEDGVRRRRARVPCGDLVAHSASRASDLCELRGVSDDRLEGLPCLKRLPDT